MTLLLNLHLFTTLTLFGLIWTVQLVHYPSFHFVSQQKFQEFENFHSHRISLLVMPLMLAEALSALWLWIDARPESTYLWALNLGFLFGIWAVTFAVSVPCHRRLAAGYDEKVVNRLIRTNWLRTTFWTAKALIVVYSLIYGGV